MGQCFVAFASGAVSAAAHRELVPMDAIPDHEEPAEAHGEQEPLVVQVLLPRRCTSPCACCFYSLGTKKDDEYTYTPGWRLFGGHWSWWHKNALSRSQGQQQPLARDA